ncbi:MAG: hypothetical protein V4494_07100 [Chlamydiota bacterium]
MFEILITSSLLLSLLIAVLSFPASQEKKMIASLQEELSALQLAKETEAVHAAQAFLSETAVLDSQVENLQKEIIEWRMRYDALENSIANQREELNTLRVDNYQLSLLFHHPAPPKIVEVVKIDPKDIQLRHQFEEKSDLLHETRKSLFHVENSFLALQREQRESFLELPPQESLLTHQLSEAESTCVALEAEIAALHDVIKTLIAPKKVSKPKKQELLQTSFI